jgi:hypothetical protein
LAGRYCGVGSHWVCGLPPNPERRRCHCVPCKNADLLGTNIVGSIAGPTSSTRSLCFLEGVSRQVDASRVSGGQFDAFEHSRKNRVREPSIVSSPPPVLADVPPSPAHPSNRVLAQINKNWRVVDDPLQRVLQRRKGNPRKKNSGWTDRSFFTTRDGLLNCVRESCGEDHDTALSQLHAEPHPSNIENSFQIR